MPDLRFQQLTADSPIATDILPFVKDPSGVPLDRKATFQDIIDLAEANVSLQEAYDNGNTIAVTTAVTLTGSGTLLSIDDTATAKQITLDNGATDGGIVAFNGGTSTLKSNASGTLLTGSFDNYTFQSDTAQRPNFRLSNYNAAITSSIWSFEKSRGTIAVPASVVAGDEIGRIRWTGAESGGTFTANNSAAISAFATGTITATQVPMYINFQTGDGSGTPSERMRITEIGRVGIGTTGPSYRFEVVHNLGVTSAEHQISAIHNGSAAGLIMGYLADGVAATSGFMRSLSGFDLTLGAGATFSDAIFIDKDNGNIEITGNLDLKTVGKGIMIAEGANASMGTNTLIGGTITVSNTLVTANSRIFLSGQNSSGTHGELTISARTVGTDFTITSTSGTDTRLIAWQIIEPS